MRVVMVFGTFDVIHPGHLFLLKEARKLGDELVAVAALDRTVEAIKGKRPYHDQETRRRNLMKISFVGRALLGYEGDKYRIIEEVKPSVIVLGYDQKIFAQDLGAELEKRSIKCEIVRLGPYKESMYHSSIIKRNLRS